MTVRTKLAWQYFIAAVILFAVGYGGAYASDVLGGDGLADKPANKPAATATPDADKPGKDGKSGAGTLPGQAGAAQSKPGESYTVQSGDTISIIADARGVGVEDLAEYNEIQFPYTITAGQTLKIPPKR